MEADAVAVTGTTDDADRVVLVAVGLDRDDQSGSALTPQNELRPELK